MPGRDPSSPADRRKNPARKKTDRRKPAAPQPSESREPAPPPGGKDKAR